MIFEDSSSAGPVTPEPFTTPLLSFFERYGHALKALQAVGYDERCEYAEIIGDTLNQLAEIAGYGSERFCDTPQEKLNNTSALVGAACLLLMLAPPILIPYLIFYRTVCSINLKDDYYRILDLPDRLETLTRVVIDERGRGRRIGEEHTQSTAQHAHFALRELLQQPEQRTAIALALAAYHNIPPPERVLIHARGEGANWLGR